MTSFNVVLFAEWFAYTDNVRFKNKIVSFVLVFNLIYALHVVGHFLSWGRREAEKSFFFFSQALADGKRCVSIYWLNDILEIKALRVPWLAIHVPTLFTHRNKPATKHVRTQFEYLGYKQL